MYIQTNSEGLKKPTSIGVCFHLTSPQFLGGGQEEVCLV